MTATFISGRTGSPPPSCNSSFYFYPSAHHREIGKAEAQIRALRSSPRDDNSADRLSTKTFTRGSGDVLLRDGRAHLNGCTLQVLGGNLRQTQRSVEDIREGRVQGFSVFLQLGNSYDAGDLSLLSNPRAAKALISPNTTWKRSSPFS
jgi:hypothetical protein